RCQAAFVNCLDKPDCGLSDWCLTPQAVASWKQESSMRRSTHVWTRSVVWSVFGLVTGMVYLMSHAASTTLAADKSDQADRSSAEPSTQQVTSIEGITEYRLDNGLKVLLFPDVSKPTV